MATKYTHKEKLCVEYPVIKDIKRKMKDNDDISESQVKKFDSRVRGSPFLLEIIQHAQKLFESTPNDKDETRENKRLGMIIRGHLDTIKNRDKEIAELKEKLETQENELNTRRAYD